MSSVFGERPPVELGPDGRRKGISPETTKWLERRSAMIAAVVCRKGMPMQWGAKGGSK